MFAKLVCYYRFDSYIGWGTDSYLHHSASCVRWQHHFHCCFFDFVRSTLPMRPSSHFNNRFFSLNLDLIFHFNLLICSSILALSSEYVDSESYVLCIWTLTKLFADWSIPIPTVFYPAPVCPCSSTSVLRWVGTRLYAPTMIGRCLSILCHFTTVVLFITHYLLV